MTPGQRASFAKLPKVERYHRERRRHYGLPANDYAAEFAAAGGTFEEFEAGVTLAELVERNTYRPTVDPRADRAAIEAYRDPRDARRQARAAMTRSAPPTSYATRWPTYVPVPWDRFESADRYHCEAVPE